MYGKVCNKCGGSDLGSQGQCKPCRARWQRDWNKKNPAKVSKAQRDWALNNPEAKISNARIQHLKKYSMTPETYSEMFLSQDGRCKICATRKQNGPGKVFMVDHCHATNVVRGLLCSHCNSLLGHCKDSVEVLRNAIKYLKTGGKNNVR